MSLKTLKCAINDQNKCGYYKGWLIVNYIVWKCDLEKKKKNICILQMYLPDINILDKFDSFPWADGPTWKHPFGHLRHQERHGCFWAGSGSQWPTKYHADIWQLNSTVSQSRAGQAQLWPKCSWAPHDSKEEPSKETCFAAKDHHPRLDWCKLYWQMVKDDLPNCLFILQRCLLALLCKLKRKTKDITEGKNKQNIFLVCIWFISYLCDLVTLNWSTIFRTRSTISLNTTFGIQRENLVEERLQMYKVPVPE